MRRASVTYHMRLTHFNDFRVGKFVTAAALSVS